MQRGDGEAVPDQNPGPVADGVLALLAVHLDHRGVQPVGHRLPGGRAAVGEDHRRMGRDTEGESQSEQASSHGPQCARRVLRALLDRMCED